MHRRAQNAMAQRAAEQPGRVAMYELDNAQPDDGIDLPDNSNSNNAFRNQFVLENFLHKIYPVRLDWGNKDMEFLVVIESKKNIVAMSALIPYERKSKVHLCVMAVDEKWRRRGIGTEMLKHIVMMHPHKKITLSVPFEQPGVLGFYMKNGRAKMKSVNTERRCFVLSLVNVKLLGEVPLP